MVTQNIFHGKGGRIHNNDSQINSNYSYTLTAVLTGYPGRSLWFSMGYTNFLL
ncbi:hypothetical protein [Endozoicomonas sp. SESOKO1]|uniref:hypothetical protein n=1 Tax=Endozoicomonas sp. SESOKO1 TaxID=2828742 RepID=UPI0021498BA5|nr:hypothetical protein [Endozoicomonas sp. SESOKO1]